MQKGIATLELLIALAILTLILSGIIIISFGNQAVAVDSGVRGTALSLVRSVLDESVYSVSNDDVPELSFEEGIFSIGIDLLPTTECLTEVGVSAYWWQDRISPKELSLSSHAIHSDVFDSLNGDCNLSTFSFEEDSELKIIGEYSLSSFGWASDLDVVYLGSSKYAFVSMYNELEEVSDIFVFDLSSSVPNLLGQIETLFPITTIDIVEDLIFAGTSSSTAQLLVIDAENLSELGPVISATQLPGVSGDHPGTESLYFYEPNLLVGTKRTVGHELHVFEVNPNTIRNDSPEHLGSIELNHNSHDIFVRDDYAYISTSDTHRRIICYRYIRA